MEKFEKLVAIEPVNLLPWAENELDRCAGEIRMYADRPADDDEIIRRIGDADAVLVSHSTPVTAAVMDGCPNIKVYWHVLLAVFSGKRQRGHQSG